MVSKLKTGDDVVFEVMDPQRPGDGINYIGGTLVITSNLAGAGIVSAPGQRPAAGPPRYHRTCRLYFCLALHLGVF